jgi:hypothetical protein
VNSLRLLLPAVLLLGANGFVGTAYADLFTVQGSTSGAFFDTSNVNKGSNIGHLTFTGASFGPTSGDALTLGKFVLANGTDDYTGDTFDLMLTFSLPAGVTGGPVVGDLTGSVHGNSGNLTLAFDGPAHFSFAGGTFDLTANDLTIVHGSDGSILTGTLSNEIGPAPVPEPFSVVLLATSLGIVGFTQRRRPTRGH